MIDAKMSEEAQALLSTVIACLVEDEHLEMLTQASSANAEAKAERLHQLGLDIAYVARTFTVILRRSVTEADPSG